MTSLKNRFIRVLHIIGYCRLVVLSLMFVWGASGPQLSVAHADSVDGYSAQWARMDSLLGQKLPESAKTLGYELLAKAVKERNDAMVGKAWQQLICAYQAMHSDSLLQLVCRLKESLPKYGPAAQAIGHSMLADLYISYCQVQARVIRSRTALEQDSSTDIRTWNMARFQQVIFSESMSSLLDEENLQSISSETYASLLIGDKSYLRFEPTLFDLLALKAVDLIEEVANYTTFQRLDHKPEWYGTNQEFARVQLDEKDGRHPTFLILKIFQRLARYHTEQSLTEADVWSHFQRLQYLKSLYPVASFRKLYEKSLEQLAGGAYGLPVLPEIQAARAEWLFQRGESASSLAVSRDILQKHPEGPVAAYCRELEWYITRCELEQFSVPDISLPGEKIQSVIRFRNADSLHVRIIPVSVREKVMMDSRKLDLSLYFQDRPKDSVQLGLVQALWNRAPIQEQDFVLPGTPDYLATSFEFVLDELPLGQYLIIASCGHPDAQNQKNTGFTTCTVSNMHAFLRNCISGSQRGLYVVRRHNGVPVVHAKIGFLSATFTPTFTLLATDEMGFLSFPGNSDGSHLIVVREQDTLMMNLSNAWRVTNNQRTTPILTLFTDRGIYRPGQTIFFKGVLRNANVHNPEVVGGFRVTVRLRGPASQEVASKTFTSDEFGSISGSFEAPKNQLKGQYVLQTSYGSANINIEEYKRPSFELTLSGPETAYCAGDSIVIKGIARTFSGQALEDAQVHYALSHKLVVSLFEEAPEGPQVSGYVSVGEDGTFLIPLRAPLLPENAEMVHSTLNVTVTDRSGESVTEQTSVVSSRGGILIDSQMPSVFLPGDSVYCLVRTNNWSAVPIPGRVLVEVFPLVVPEKIRFLGGILNMPGKNRIPEATFRELFPSRIYDMETERSIRSLPSGERAFGTDVATQRNGRTNIPDFKNLAPGFYRVRISLLDSSVNKERVNGTGRYYDDLFFRIVGPKPTPILSMDEWITPMKVSGEPGEFAEFRVAAGIRNSVVLFEHQVDNEIVSKELIKTGQTPEVLRIPLSKEYINKQQTVHFLLMQEGEIFHKSATLTTNAPSRKLQLRVERFRSNMTPGGRELISISIKSPAGGAVAAEMVASMYDASLDKLTSFSWPSMLPAGHRPYIRSILWDSSRAPLSRAFYNQRALSPRWNPSYPLLGSLCSFAQAFVQAFDKEGVYVEELDEVQRMNVGVEEPMLGVLVADPDDVRMSGLSNVRIRGTASSNWESDGEASGEMQHSSGALVIRKNFEETAFFKPSLRADSTGTVHIDFVVPESLTRWNFLGFAHTKTAEYARIVKTLTTSLPLSISAYTPRFFREGDTLTLRAVLRNSSDTLCAGTVTMEIFDPSTDKTVGGMLLSAVSHKIEVPGDRSETVEWKLAVPRELPAVGVRTIVCTEQFSDGEEKIVPVLSRQILVTETLPFAVGAQAIEHYVFEPLSRQQDMPSATLRTRNFAYDMTYNPIWDVVLTLPYQVELPRACLDYVYNRFVINSMASGIANRNPALRKAFELWRKQPDTTAFLSKLEQNPELKDILLQETPWLLTARKTAEKMQQISNLFDSETISSEQKEALTKMSKMQNPDGGMAWFPGMPSSQYCSQIVAVGLVRLQKLGMISGAIMNQAAPMLSKVSSYLDRMWQKTFEDFRSAVSSAGASSSGAPSSGISFPLSYWSVHYLYVRSFSESVPQTDVYRYLMQKVEKEWNTRSLCEQAIIALVLERSGNKEVALGIVRSLTERATRNKKDGMFWAQTLEQTGFWYDNPVEIQALLAEVYADVAKDPGAVSDINLWLLKNKRTNDWNFSAALSACYSLLCMEDNPVSEAVLPEITIGRTAGSQFPLERASGKEIHPQTGNGYFKVTWDSTALQSLPAHLTIVNPNKNPVWGGLYWQYTEDSDKLPQTATTLSIEKEYFLVENGVLKAIRPSDPVKVGDVVSVRLIIRNQQVLQYVHLKDMRGAGLEPLGVLSRSKYQDGLWYYESPGDVATSFFIEQLPVGTRVFEYRLRATHQGRFSNGITSIQCLYAPEFTARTAGSRIIIK